jgi:hypothetical protein
VWDGKWWAESFDDDERPTPYDLLLAKFEGQVLTHVLAREFFQIGHEHGYELRANLEYD